MIPRTSNQEIAKNSRTEKLLRWTGFNRRSADQSTAEALLRAAVSQSPESVMLRRKLAGFLYDNSRWVEAKEVLAPALSDADIPSLRLDALIASATGDLDTAVRQFEKVSKIATVGALANLATAVSQRDGVAAGGEIARAALAADASDWASLAVEASRLALYGMADELDKLCAHLEERGASHAELYACWAVAKAMLGDEMGVSRLIDCQNLVSIGSLRSIREPNKWSQFNGALRAEIESHINRIPFHPTRAATGGCRIDELRTTNATYSIQLAQYVCEEIDCYVAQLNDCAPNPFSAYRGEAVRLNMWALLLDDNSYEGWHVHPESLISGVYYVDVPTPVDSESGALEFGLLPLGGRSLLCGKRMIVQPNNGMLVLFPSSYAHRTIPIAQPATRISVAFDVVRA